MPASDTRKETVEPRWGVNSRTVPLSQARPPDLSFNNIEAIEGLDTLVNLEDLSLFNNRISKIDSLDALVKLQVLSLGNNHIGNMMNVSVGAGRGGGAPHCPAPHPRKARNPDSSTFRYQLSPWGPACGCNCAPPPPLTQQTLLMGAFLPVGRLACAQWGQRPTAAPPRWQGQQRVQSSAPGRVVRATGGVGEALGQGLGIQGSVPVCS